MTNPADMTEHTVVKGLARLVAERQVAGRIQGAMNAQAWAEARVSLAEKAALGGMKAGQLTYGVYWRVIPACCKGELGPDCYPTRYVLENKRISREDLLIALTEAAILAVTE